MADIPIVELMDKGTLTRPANIVYSTNPWTSSDSNGVEYVVKGPDPNVVIGETLAHVLAREVEIVTPGFALGYFGDAESDLYFASVMETSGLRTTDALLASSRNASAIVALGEIVAFDAWIMNWDRNIGNLLTRASKGKKDPLIVAIDFEKSAALHGPYTLIESAKVEPKKLRPTGTLGSALTPPIQWDGLVRRVQALTDQKIQESVEMVRQVIGSFSWSESTCQLLQKRRTNLRHILAEIWS